VSDSFGEWACRVTVDLAALVGICLMEEAVRPQFDEPNWHYRPRSDTCVLRNDDRRQQQPTMQAAYPKNTE